MLYSKKFYVFTFRLYIWLISNTHEMVKEELVDSLRSGLEPAIKKHSWRRRIFGAPEMESSKRSKSWYFRCRGLIYRGPFFEWKIPNSANWMAEIGNVFSRSSNRHVILIAIAFNCDWYGIYLSAPIFILIWPWRNWSLSCIIEGDQAECI